MTIYVAVVIIIIIIIIVVVVVDGGGEVNAVASAAVEIPGVQTKE